MPFLRRPWRAGASAGRAVRLAAVATVFAAVLSGVGIGGGGPVSSVAYAQRDDDREIRWLLSKGFLSYGHVQFSYENTESEREFAGGSSRGSGYRFYQDYSINLKSYVFHPKLLTYTMGFGLTEGSGSLDTHDMRRYRLELDFLRTRPFNFSIRSSYIDGSNYDTFNAGLSAVYGRDLERLRFRNMRERSQYNAMQRANMKNVNKNNNNRNNQNNQNNQDYNNDYDENENYNENYENENYENYNENYDNYNENYNNYNENYDDNQNGNYSNQYNYLNGNPGGRRGVLSSVLPTAYLFDFDRSETIDETGPNDSVDYRASLRVKGNVETVNTFSTYWALAGYEEYEDTNNVWGGDTETYSAEANTRTRFANNDNLNLHAGYTEEVESGTDSYEATAGYNGMLDSGWYFGLNGGYYNTGDALDSSQYSLSGTTGSSSRIGRLGLLYQMGAAYRKNELIGDDSYSLFARGGADARLRRDLSMGVNSRVEWGKEIASYSLRLDARFTPSRRISYAAFYDFATSSGTYARESETSGFAGQTRHQMGVGANGGVKNVRFSSSLTETVYNGGTSLLWNNSVSTIILYRVNFVLGASVARETGDGIAVQYDDQDSVVRLSLYNVMTTSFWRNSAFRIYSSYNKLLDGAYPAYDYSINPSLSWRIRKVYLSGEYKYQVYKLRDSRTTEQKVYLKLTRPFWI